MITPNNLQAQLPLTPACETTIKRARQAFIDILTQKDDRVVVIVGPCSIHDTDAAILYAEKLRQKIETHRDTLCIIMRTYVEKSRTTTGWKGFINDPDLNNTFLIEKGLFQARSLLIAINALGVPTASEIINPLTAPYFVDLLTWAAIGARTSESQIHREFASQLPIPVGFKNTTDGNVQVAIDAIQTAQEAHHFLGIDSSGKIALLQSSGNSHCHIVLRGSKQQSNYDEMSLHHAQTKLQQLSLHDRVMVDCSHGNSQKNPLEQMRVLSVLTERIQQNDQTIFGVMIESHLTAGKQHWTPHQKPSPFQSITDACSSWEETEIALNQLSHAVQKRRENVLNCI